MIMSCDLDLITLSSYVMFCANWYHSNDLKNVKNPHGEVLLLVKCLLKVTLLHGCFSCFLYCTYGTKSCNASHVHSFHATSPFSIHPENILFSTGVKRTQWDETGKNKNASRDHLIDSRLIVSTQKGSI